MTFRRLWFPGALVVAVVLGGVFGLATNTGTSSPDDRADSTTTAPTTTDDSTTDDSTSSTAATDGSTTTDNVTTSGPESPTGVAVEVALSHEWTLLTQASREIPALQPIPQQTALVIADLDGDGVDDIVGAGRQGLNAIEWLQRSGETGLPRSIAAHEFDIEAGGTAGDIDGDGDLDLVFGGDFRSNEVWWWENPAPDFDAAWTRRTIKNDGANQHHDMLFADLNGDGADELVFWNNMAEPATLWVAPVPADPTVDEPWAYSAIWLDSGQAEGLDALDVNDDGDIDLLASGTLLLNDGTGQFSGVAIVEGEGTRRGRIGQLIDGGAPELVFNSGDGVGPLVWYQWNGEEWVPNVLLDRVDHGHSLDLADVDGDGDLDILAAEMRLDAGDAARLHIFYGDGSGTFTSELVATGFDNHESQFADVDGDGDIDVVSKPFNWFTPRIDIWANNQAASLAQGWDRVVLDADRPERAVFVLPADIDGDGDADLISGPDWLVNPGSVEGPWERRAFGEGLNQAFISFDVDNDGDLDVVGSRGVGSEPNPGLVWAQNDGSGTFTIFDNIERATGDFVQGAAFGLFGSNSSPLLLVSWHAGGDGVQTYAIPEDPTAGRWLTGKASSESQEEELTVGDIDLDGDLDVMMGTRWIRNDGSGGAVLTLHEPATGTPDRNRLVDMDGDGDLDVVVSYEDAVNGRVAWYERGTDPAALWTEHPIGNVTLGLSLDVADMDGDGDLDVVVGEHSTTDTIAMSLLLFENAGDNNTWVQGQISVGDEHHDGAQLVDLDGDGDLDVVSIGWTHGRTLAYLNPLR